MSLDTIIGHENIKHQLKNAIKKGRFSHASIIVGEDGIGKSLIAKEAAKMIINKHEDRDYGDIVEFHIKDKKSIGIDDIRLIIEEINKKPIEGNKKIVIIYKAHLITEVAQNAFLKTIEEPPKGVFIILLCESIKKMLDTIVSRCEIYKLSKLSFGQMKKFVDYKYNNLTKEEINSIIVFSDGIPGRVEKFIEDQSLQEIREFTLNIIKDVDDIDGYNYIYKYEPWLLKYKNNWEEMLTCFLSYLRDGLIYKETGKEDFLLNIDKKDDIKYISEKFSFIKLNKMISIVNNTQDKLSSNVNFSLVFDEMLIKMREV